MATIQGGVIPLVIGAYMYAETNEDFQEVLKVCARMAVARGDAVHVYTCMCNSLIFETEVKGGASMFCRHPIHLLSSSDCWCHCPRSLSPHIRRNS